MADSKYTYYDIIIDPRDPRLEGAIGKEVYCNDTPFDVLQGANENKGTGILTKIDRAQVDCFPFSVNIDNNEIVFCCIIIKKEPEVKYVPFDLSKKEDRDFLRGKWVRHKTTGVEYQITQFSCRNNVWTVIANTGEELLKYFTFLDGTPVRKKVEE